VIFFFVSAEGFRWVRLCGSRVESSEAAGCPALLARWEWALAHCSQCLGMVCQLHRCQVNECEERKGPIDVHSSAALQGSVSPGDKFRVEWLCLRHSRLHLVFLFIILGFDAGMK